MPGERLDVLLHERGLVESREKARGLILAGQVMVDGRRIDKPGTRVEPDAVLEITGDVNPYVSRGGLKLEAALEAFQIDVRGKVVLDVGASTGGFTDCLLKKGAARVYAVDVGYGQMDWRLRQDPRVIIRERTNIRYVTPDQFPELMDICTIDVSFISLALVFPAVVPLIKAQGEMVALVKPQFEAGREQVGKKGVVRDPEVHIKVLERVLNEALKNGLVPLNAVHSPITGPQGNIEFFVHLTRDESVPAASLDVAELVARAHAVLR